MKKLLNNHIFKKIFFIDIIIVFILCLMPTKDITMDDSISHLDKIIHSIMYISLSFLGIFAYPNKKYIHYMPLLLALIVMGVIIEILQDIIPTGRSFDFYDMIANTVGVFIGSLSFFISSRVNYLDSIGAK